MVEALIFDFDGLILETEGPSFECWCEIYESHGATLELSTWVACIGSSDIFDVYEHLASLTGQPVDRPALAARYQEQVARRLAEQSPLPGVREYIAAAKQAGLKLAIASSSSRAWVTGHLARFGLEGEFDCIKCSDDVERTKPDPALYLAALETLEVRPEQAIVLEDSVNGVTAAKRAGIFTVAVPGPLTRELVFDHADLRLTSLAELPLEQLIRLVEARQGEGTA